MKDELDRTKYPRMPWHDVQCALYGPPCRDVARHFVQRWNYAKVCLFHCILIIVFPFIIVNKIPFFSRGTKLPMSKEFPC